MSGIRTYIWGGYEERSETAASGQEIGLSYFGSQDHRQ